jgi:hypothetical protein
LTVDTDPRRKIMATKAEHANRAAHELETVVTRLFEVQEQHPRWFKSSADLTDALDWALDALEHAVTALPNTDLSRPFIMERLDSSVARRDSF